jgi:hypothetical protein
VKKFFWVYGLGVLLLLGAAEFRGWSLTSYDELKGVPKSLRDNPGSYRSTYSRYFHK